MAVQYVLNMFVGQIVLDLQRYASLQTRVVMKCEKQRLGDFSD